jgi:cold shock protein
MPERPTDGPVLKGIVRWFNPDKGYGFIDVDGRDVFMHASELSDPCADPIPGHRVTFKLGQRKGGRTAAVEIVIVG